ncbi:ADP-ribosyl-[dinitrogen reductase] glycohydrolase [Clostridium acetireducens DSM 10703]|jgi:ADP-ribosylglycohydrolase|uniref:ADP-ribosyl-[dinitrogen reductase] glycohydrolase n=1 Tax=Clostridium acetireducens DSM 10703 TaxID=1121290 RepID=A0A1E8EW39_9CLOT|nr:ADP-ribosylglycohydrolase family protein [Clostridium acetireducens]OFH99473.1 ADP-ribosyl-[dinitrogen reductase] glycohydrolase [Clostridium acetireducens DSM 10703]
MDNLKEVLIKKVYGALVGVAIGDTMGMPAEWFTREEIKTNLVCVEDFVEPPKQNLVTYYLKMGQVTDDTIQTFLLAESIVENGGKVVSEDIMEKLIKWIDGMSEELKEEFIGPSVKEAFKNYKKGVTLREVGINGTTNGAAMRIVPVGIISSFQEVEKLIDNVELASLPTHNTNVAISGACAIASAVACGICGMEDLNEIIETASKTAIKALKKGFDVPAPSVGKRIKIAIDIVKKAYSEEDALQNLYDIIGTGFSASESVPCALALVYLSKANTIKCAKLAANIGGDTDTIGAMACGICGAIKGIDSIPSKYIDLIYTVNNLDFKGMAEKLTDILIKSM